MKIQIEDSWKSQLNDELEASYFIDLMKFISQEYESQVVYPSEDKIFNAFNHCSFNETKVVIVGQDPYHGINQANGLCFSVNDGVRFPPSLKNIFKELNEDLGITPPLSGNLERWSQQGILMLNATLTVREKSPGSHQKKGWEQFSDAIIKLLNDKQSNLVFILWGAYAQKKGRIIDRKKHFVIESAHPSPFSVHKGFYGSKPFSKTNEFLESIGKDMIEW